MTQIELLPCPWCGTVPVGRDHRDVTGEGYYGVECRQCRDVFCGAHGEDVATVHAAWNTRAAPPTRSDTREQAAASPSAVGEGQPCAWITPEAAEMLGFNVGAPKHTLKWVDVTLRFQNDTGNLKPIYLSSQAPPSAVDEGHDFETQQIMIADPRKFIVTHVYKVKRDGWQRVDSYQCASAESARILLEMLTRSLSSQAPKPASAGGDFAEDARDVLDRFYWMLSPDAKGNHTVKHLSVKAVIRLCEKIIAAEADTATPPDRLAPIEARGAVTDAMEDAAIAAISGVDLIKVGGWKGVMRIAIEAALRARESAPAVETPPNSA